MVLTGHHSSPPEHHKPIRISLQYNHNRWNTSTTPNVSINSARPAAISLGNVLSPANYRHSPTAITTILSITATLHHMATPMTVLPIISPKQTIQFILFWILLLPLLLAPLLCFCLSLSAISKSKGEMLLLPSLLPGHLKISINQEALYKMKTNNFRTHHLIIWTKFGYNWKKQSQFSFDGYI